MMTSIRTSMMVSALALLAILFAMLSVADIAHAEETIEIPIEAQQTFLRKLHTFLTSKKEARRQLENVDAEEIKQLKEFREAGSIRERDTAAGAMGRAMLSRIGRLTQVLDGYSASIKGLRKALINMANVARVRKTRASLTPHQFNRSMVSYEAIARQLTRIDPGRDAVKLYGLASQLASKHRIRIANRNRFRRSSATRGNTTDMIADRIEDLHASEEQLIALAGTLKEMVRGIQEARMSRNIFQMRDKLEQIQGLGKGLTSAYLGGYNEVLNYMANDGKATDASSQSGTSYTGQAFPRLGRVHSAETGEGK